jgi:hypothetical protein
MHFQPHIAKHTARPHTLPGVLELQILKNLQRVLADLQNRKSLSKLTRGTLQEIKT